MTILVDFRAEACGINSSVTSKQDVNLSCLIKVLRIDLSKRATSDTFKSKMLDSSCWFLCNKLTYRGIGCPLIILQQGTDSNFLIDKSVIILGFRNTLSLLEHVPHYNMAVLL